MSLIINIREKKLKDLKYDIQNDQPFNITKKGKWCGSAWVIMFLPNLSMTNSYRKKKPNIDISLYKKNLKLIRCNITNFSDLTKLKNFIIKHKFKWDLIFSSVGTSEPIGSFFNLDFKNWENSLNINMISQLKTIHKLYPLRNKNKICNIALLAGSGTNGPIRNYSAYCVSKIVFRA